MFAIVMILKIRCISKNIACEKAQSFYHLLYDRGNLGH